MIRFLLVLFSVASEAALGQTPSSARPPPMPVSEHLWQQFSTTERAEILARFPDIEVIPAESIGIVQSAQLVDRSTIGTTSGAALGGALGQTLYIDNAFRATDANYSATAQLGAGILGALLGATLDKPPQRRFIINYGIRTPDGQVRELKVDSGEEFTRPTGQCVFIPAMTPAPANLCLSDKTSFLKRLSALSQAPGGAVVSREISGVSVNCRVPGVGLMTLEKTACTQVDGVEEK